MYTIKPVLHEAALNKAIDQSRFGNNTVKDTSFSFPSFSDEFITLTPNQIIEGNGCSKKIAFLKSGLTSGNTPAAMLLSKALRFTIGDYLNNHVTKADMGQHLSAKFSSYEISETNPIVYSATYDRSKVIGVGRDLASGFPDYFKSHHLKPLHINLPLAFEINGKIICPLIVDFVGQCERDLYNASAEKIATEGDIVVLDWSMHSQPSKFGFQQKSVKTSLACIALSAFSETLGITPPHIFGAGEGIKKKNAYWLTQWSTIHKSVQLEALQSTVELLRRIDDNDYTSNPMNAFNSQCQSTMGACEFLEACLYGSTSTLNNPRELSQTDVIRLSEPAGEISFA